MWRNYFIIVYRNILRQKLNTFVNIFGLAAGISAATLIFLYVDTEFSYDKNWESSTELFRINENFNYNNGEVNSYALTSKPLADRATKIFPDCEITRVGRGQYGRDIYIDEKWVTPGTIVTTDTNFFKIFTYPHHELELYYDSATPLAWVSNDVFEKHFKKYNLREFKYGDSYYAIKGVFYPRGYYSHLRPDIILPDQISQNNGKEIIADWTHLRYSTYIRSDISPDDIQNKLEKELKTEVDSFTQKYNLDLSISFPVISLHSIHFDSEYLYDSLSNNDKRIVWLFSFIGLLILIIASINYVNMAIAQGGIRSREIAIRKTMGATRNDIVYQFLGESMSITFFAIVTSFILTEILFPAFNSITGYDMRITHVNIFSRELSFLFIVWIVLGGMSGFYPAFVISQFQPITIFRGGSNRMMLRNLRSYSISSTKVRKLMLIGQFLVSGAIIIATIVIFLQTRYLLNRDLGFNINKLLVMEFESDSSNYSQYKQFLDALKNVEGVERVSMANTIPGKRTGRLLFRFQRNNESMQKTIDFFDGNADYANVLGLEVIAGRLFDPYDEEIRKNEVLVNETMVNEMGWDEPLGKKIGSGIIEKHIVVGVVKDFHYYSLHENINPLVITPGLFKQHYIVINSNNPGDLYKSDQLLRVYRNFFPNIPEKISVLSESYNSQYAREQKLLNIFSYFSGLSIVISCLGLFALSAFSAQKRSKEISIRKILGAGNKNVLQLIYTEYFQIIVLASSLAWVTAYVFADQWLAGFVEEVPVGMVPYLLGTFMVIGLGVFTISYHALKVLETDPVKFLKYE